VRLLNGGNYVNRRGGRAILSGRSLALVAFRMTAFAILVLGPSG